MTKKARIKQDEKYDKMIDSKASLTFYKDRFTEVPEDYILMDELEYEGESSKKKDSKKSGKKKKSKKAKKKAIDELSSIKGIGKETIEDLKRIYSSVDDLIESLKENKVPLRNDKVNILRKNFGIK